MKEVSREQINEVVGLTKKLQKLTGKKVLFLEMFEKSKPREVIVNGQKIIVAFGDNLMSQAYIGHTVILDGKKRSAKYFYDKLHIQYKIDRTTEQGGIMTIYASIFRA